MNFEVELTNKYWQEELKLAKLADSLGTSRSYLIESPLEFGEVIVSQVSQILWQQVDILKKINKVKRQSLASNSVISLSSFSQLAR